VKNTNNEWVLIDNGPMTLGKIPLVTHYTFRIGDFIARPPFEDLSWLNIEHWQSSSDQRNALRYGRSAILFLQGFNVKNYRIWR